MVITAAFFIFMVYAVTLASSDPCGALHHYRELACAPVMDKTTNDTCPVYFECPPLHPQSDKCYYRGRAYDNREQLPSEEVLNRCSIACYCEVRNGTVNNTRSTFECAAVDCVEDYSSGSGEPEEECVSTYELSDCCSSGKVCGKDELSKLATCTVDGTTYREGQRFYPAKTCQVCVCTKAFNGSVTDVDYCTDIDCGLEIHYQMELANNCAPVLLNQDSCCPHKWECPDNTTQIIEGRRPSAVEATCKFGSRALRVGDQVVVEDKCTQCACDTPPFVTCAQKTECLYNYGDPEQNS